MKRESIDLETIHRYNEHGREEHFGCRLIGENIPEVGTDVYRECFFTEVQDYFTKEGDLSRRVEKFESMTEYEFVVLSTYMGWDVYNFTTFDTANVFTIEFTLREKSSPLPKKQTLLERIIRYFI